MLGLEAQVGGAPPARHHDDGRDAAQLARDGHPQPGLVRRPAPLGVLAGAPHDGVVRAGGPGDVHLVDAVVLREVGTDGAVAVDHADDARLDQRRQRPAVHPEQRTERGVELHERGAIVRGELVEGVQRRDGRDVAGTQHQADTPVLADLTRPQAGAVAHLPLGHARRHPDLGREPVEQHPLLRGAGQHAYRHASAGRGTDGEPVEGRAAGRERLVRPGVGGGALQRAVRAGHPVLAGVRGGRRDVLGHLGDRRVHPPEQCSPVRDGQLGPALRTDLELVDRPVELTLRRGSRVRHAHQLSPSTARHPTVPGPSLTRAPIA